MTGEFVVSVRLPENRYKELASIAHTQLWFGASVMTAPRAPSARFTRATRIALSSGLALAGLLLTATCPAAECAPANGFSPCVDADNLWFAPSRARFVGIPPGESLRAGELMVGLGAIYQYRPFLLKAASPDPEGRDIIVVDDALNFTALASAGVSKRFELYLAVPFTAWQTGAGVEGVTFQNGPALPHQALRDPRLGAGMGFVEPASAEGFTAKGLLQLGLPLGNEAALAGSRSLVLAPSAVFGFEHGRFFSGAEIGLRLRQGVTIGGARLGSQLVLSLGAGFRLLANELLAVCVEGTALPTLSSQAHSLPNGTHSQGTLIPAEWLLSLRSSLLRSKELTLQLGGGTGIPLSSETRTHADGASESEHFAGITTPKFRVVFAARYAFDLNEGEPK